MKKSIHILLTLAFTLLVTLASCSPKADVNEKPILSQILHQEDIRSFKVPGFLVRHAMRVSEETRMIRPALKGITSVTISISEDLADPKNVFTRINARLNKANYCSFMEVIDNDSRITIKALEKDGNIREMVIIIDDNSSFVCLGVKGNINPDSFMQLVTNLTEEGKLAANM
ncbi:MAG: DUF4252 domain-containing protein [Tenuifilaceae bacterium]|nr:DUF4252 domain-containing protein [Tenuifilaceae bacterium]